nr:unnamed protein product [Digitaria exilis]
MTCLAWNDLDVAFREDRPAAPAEGQTSPAFDKWERSNRMATMVMSQTISPGIKGAIPLKNAQGVEYSAKELLTKIEENFKSSSKTYASTLIMKLVSSQYNGKTGIREHILSMCDMANKLKEMQMEISDGFLVHFILTSLPSPQYAAFKINYNTTKAIWTLSDLISYCVEEEERLKTEKMKDVVNMVGNLSLSETPKNQHESGSSKQGAKKNFKKNKNKNFAPKHENKFKKSSHTSGGKMLCSFCESPKHLQKNCAGFKEWLKQQGNIKFDSAWKLEFLPSQANPVGVQKSLKERLRYKPDVVLNIDSNTASPAFPVAMHNTTAGIRPDPTPMVTDERRRGEGNCPHVLIPPLAGRRGLCSSTAPCRLGPACTLLAGHRGLYARRSPAASTASRARVGTRGATLAREKSPPGCSVHAGGNETRPGPNPHPATIPLSPRQVARHGDDGFPFRARSLAPGLNNGLQHAAMTTQRAMAIVRQRARTGGRQAIGPVVSSSLLLLGN